jgi:hypothetical protein
MKFDIVSMAPKRGTEFRRTFPARQWSGLHLSECYKGIKKGPNRVLERPVLTPGEWAGVIRERIGVRPDGPPAKPGAFAAAMRARRLHHFSVKPPKILGFTHLGDGVCPHCVHTVSTGRRASCRRQSTKKQGQWASSLRNPLSAPKLFWRSALQLNSATGFEPRQTLTPLKLLLSPSPA